MSLEDSMNIDCGSHSLCLRVNHGEFVLSRVCFLLSGVNYQLQPRKQVMNSGLPLSINGRMTSDIIIVVLTFWRLPTRSTHSWVPDVTCRRSSHRFQRFFPRGCVSGVQSVAPRLPTGCTLLRPVCILPDVQIRQGELVMPSRL